MNHKLNDILSTQTNKEEELSHVNYRPSSLNDFIGQSSLKENIAVYIQAAQKRNECLDHALLHGPPGLGKTTLAYIIAKELGVNIKCIQAPVLEKAADMAAHLTHLQENDIFFIDEIHCLKTKIEEILYSAMEDYKIDIILGQGANANSIRIDLPKFTLIGATTKAGLLSPPFYNRFGIIERLEFYDEEDLVKMAYRTAKLMDVSIDTESAIEIARRARGTPRIINRILKRIRDFSQIKGDGRIKQSITKEAFDSLGIDAYGLNTVDRTLLTTLVNQYNGGPVGIETLAISISEPIRTIEDIHEPFLIQKGLLSRTSRGRMATQACYNYLGIKPKQYPFNIDFTENSLFKDTDTTPST